MGRVTALNNLNLWPFPKGPAPIAKERGNIEGWLNDEELEENVNISISYRVFKYGFKPFKNIFSKALSLPQFSKKWFKAFEIIV